MFLKILTNVISDQIVVHLRKKLAERNSEFTLITTARYATALRSYAG